MKIGVFDSGLGGLVILKAIRKKLPQYDYVYLGDTKRLPYGNRTPETVYEWTKQAVEYLFAHNCKLVILACNTASVQALRKLQREHLPKHYPNRRILGVIVPTVEKVIEDGSKKVCIIGTRATVSSKAYEIEIHKRSKEIRIFQTPTPLLVPIIEEHNTRLLRPALEQYLKPLLRKKVDTIILGCTHYSQVKTEIRQLVGKRVQVISQDEVIPMKLKDYLRRHPELDKKLSRRGTIHLLLTELTAAYIKLGKQWFNGHKLQNIQLLI